MEQKIITMASTAANVGRQYRLPAGGTFGLQRRLQPQVKDSDSVTEGKIKVYIYTEALQKLEKSGVGRAIYHQKCAASKFGAEVVNSIDEADVVHINTTLPKSFILAKKLRREGKPLVYHAHSTKEDFRNSYIGSNMVAGLFKRWLIACYTKGDVIVTPSEYSKRLLQSYGITNDIFVISNGIDLNDYQRNEQAGKMFRQKYGFSDSDKVIMSAGLLIKRKGVHDFAELARRLPQYKFIWFGNADMRWVGRKVHDAVYHAPDNLTFAGYVKKPDLQAALSGSNLFLFPSYEETEGIVVLEALAMHTPTLLRDIPVYADREDNYAYFAKNNDEFARKAQDIIEGRLPDLSDSAYTYIQKKSFDHTGEQLVKAYHKAIEAQRR